MSSTLPKELNGLIFGYMGLFDVLRIHLSLKSVARLARDYITNYKTSLNFENIIGQGDITLPNKDVLKGLDELFSDRWNKISKPYLNLIFSFDAFYSVDYHSLPCEAISRSYWKMWKRSKFGIVPELKANYLYNDGVNVDDGDNNFVWYSLVDGSCAPHLEVLKWVTNRIDSLSSKKLRVKSIVSDTTNYCVCPILNYLAHDCYFKTSEHSILCFLQFTKNFIKPLFRIIGKKELYGWTIKNQIDNKSTPKMIGDISTCPYLLFRLFHQNINNVIKFNHATLFEKGHKQRLIFYCYEEHNYENDNCIFKFEFAAPFY